MDVTYLGHAGFCVETDDVVVVMDPWLSPSGAFDMAWYQFPCNHHLAALVQEKLRTPGKQKYVYLSHEHKDHFDPAFLESLQTDEFTFVIAAFRRTVLYDAVKAIPNQGIVRCLDGQELPIPGGSITLYLDDAEMDRDSAILLKLNGYAFLNMNDCKIHDRIPDVVAKTGHIDVFTAQFSGAVWHPVCYEYSEHQYKSISMKKMIGKFEAVARVLEHVKPTLYLTSAGPACFLDPMLFHINLEPVNIFPRATKFLDYLKRRLKASSTRCVEPMPGDVWDARSQTWVYLAPERVTDENLAQYLQAYAARFEYLFQSRKQAVSVADAALIFNRLKQALEEKLAELTLRDRVKIPVYFGLSDVPNRLIRVDFQANQVTFASDIPENHYYSIETPSWEIERVLDGRLTWEDFTLTLRARLKRVPDIYNVVIHGFLMMDTDDLNSFCEKVLEAESQAERIVVEAGGRQYSVNRYCPHQGADLSRGWIQQERYLVCPRHRWKYDLERGGACDQCDVSIGAVEVEEE